MLKNKIIDLGGIKHGGRIKDAAKKYTIPENEWIDLSTGINPNGWPVPHIPDNIWQSLPEDNDELQAIACNYYGCDICLPVSGSQAAIQMLPTLRSFSNVGIISPTYAEHEFHWKQSGHNVIRFLADDIEKYIGQLDVLVVVNPNNPTGEIIPAETLLNWHQQLSIKGGWLIVDEAFMDVTPENSLVPSGIKPGLIILRSIGKFFGLAGIRCGFVISDIELLQHMANKLGPWSLTGATRYIVKKALINENWQTDARIKLHKSKLRLGQLFHEKGLNILGETALFQWLTHSRAKDIHEAFATQGILIRYFEKQILDNKKIVRASLRFGIPDNENQWRRLDEVLTRLPDFSETEIT